MNNQSRIGIGPSSNNKSISPKKRKSQIHTQTHPFSNAVYEDSEDEVDEGGEGEGGEGDQVKLQVRREKNRIKQRNLRRESPISTLRHYAVLKRSNNITYISSLFISDLFIITYISGKGGIYRPS